MVEPHPTLLPDNRGFLSAMVGDGRPLISLTGLCLALSGGFALFQSATGQFLPHDTEFLQMSAKYLCGINECRIVHFMFHDRVSFGGALIAIAVLYLWLAEFPLKAGEVWAWWTLLLSGVVGFGSFLTYLGYGYLDTWHGAATLALLPCFVGGLWLSRRSISELHRHHAGGVERGIIESGSAEHAARESGTTAKGPVSSFAQMTPQNGASPRRFGAIEWRTPAGAGRVCLLLAAAGMMGAGATIQTIGMTRVFVPTDLTFMGLDRDQLNAINPRLIPLIAHDRAGFGGGVATAGFLMFCCVSFGGPVAVAVAGLIFRRRGRLDHGDWHSSTGRVFGRRAPCAGGMRGDFIFRRAGAHAVMAEWRRAGGKLVIRLGAATVKMAGAPSTARRSSQTRFTIAL